MKHLRRIPLLLRTRRALTALALIGFAAVRLVPVGAAAAAGTVPHRSPRPRRGRSSAGSRGIAA